MQTKKAVQIDPRDSDHSRPECPYCERRKEVMPADGTKIPVATTLPLVTEAGAQPTEAEVERVEEALKQCTFPDNRHYAAIAAMQGERK